MGSSVDHTSIARISAIEARIRALELLFGSVASVAQSRAHLELALAKLGEAVAEAEARFK